MQSTTAGDNAISLLTYYLSCRGSRNQDVFFILTSATKPSTTSNSEFPYSSTTISSRGAEPIQNVPNTTCRTSSFSALLLPPPAPHCLYSSPPLHLTFWFHLMGDCVGRLTMWDKVSTTSTTATDNPGCTSAGEMQTPSPPPPVSTQPQLPNEFVSRLTIPQASPHVPPRPEFIPFTIPYLCMSKPYDGKDFWSYPERCGWIVDAKDTQCHVLCPPGACIDDMDMEELPKDTQLQIFSRSDGSVVVASDKIAFLQAWLFFGVLTEVSDLCGLDIDLATEFFLEDGSVSTARLNGLPGRWFEAAVMSGRAGDKVLMERILTIARHSHLMLSEERSDDEYTLTFDYSYAECRVFLSLEILVRTVGLHLLLHTYMPGFTTTEEEGWGRNRIKRSLDWPPWYRRRPNEGLAQLGLLARDKLEEQGWCASELDLLAHDEMAFASLLSRPRIRDHSSCGDFICHAYQTEESTYRTRHVDDECSCDFVGLDTDSLIAVLSQNKVPKLVITDELELEVVSENDYPYIALSHGPMGLGTRKQTHFHDANFDVYGIMQTNLATYMSMHLIHLLYQSPSGWIHFVYLFIQASWQRVTARKPSSFSERRFMRQLQC
ncbi:uncharacterized protein EV420DRAFT_153676 [Desarmillaria tabescens]|uniref:Uncharacterized protein n=1 Tax=Armillaria tabescens TaxID=1929756 RepID=A0AA39MK88_ARMTA|nr:uncharacterized protein EV420DRAFT_153676 [Desarmillaria tabescens]KAK0437971.1 hypothetical protein EV420DRAFT_153676 [Desarmillaria tabescens]